MNITPPTYPLRPVNGGPLSKAPAKSAGAGGSPWYYEPKVNGWRALVHVPTGTMFNRRNERLSIESEFSTVLGLLQKLFPDYVWLDCEALERRHGLGRGSLIILDVVVSKKSYRERFEIIGDALGCSNCVQTGPVNVKPADHGVYRLPHFENDGLQLWQELQDENRRLGVPFYEGVVAKRADSTYPLQLRSSDVEFPFWVKHRWHW